MTFIATRLRFGRYVFAIGGNPEAAELAGIKTRWVTVRIFALMGVLAAIAAAISTARLNAATNSQGTLDELYTIAAAVIGGTSLAGGTGTIAGAMCWPPSGLGSSKPNLVAITTLPRTGWRASPTTSSLVNGP